MSMDMKIGKMILGCALVMLLGACHPRKVVQNTVQPTVQPTPATPSEAKQTPPPTAPQPSTRSRAEAIADGISFLQKAHWELDFVYLYSYLQPQNHWPDLPAQRDNARIADSLRAAGTDQALRILDQMTLFERLRNPAFVLDRNKMTAGQEEDAITVPALYCDAYPLDSATYFPKLRAEMAVGDYRLTHALLAVLWLQEHQCFAPRDLRALREALVAGCSAIIARYPSWMDLNIEAAALQQAAGERISQDWIDGVIAAQRPDGGWLDIPQHTASNTHTTILALWLLAPGK
jgi:hypothetical protein